MKNILTLFALLLLVGTGCHKKHSEKAAYIELKTGVLVDNTKLDGCGWMIMLDNGTKLQPTNLSDYKLEMVDGKKIAVEYELKPGAITTCMSGKVATITKLAVR